ncbi:MAG: leucine-rich repeat domain-containing protein [Clostridia bacterium]|nr:leucine-rich repeat domain-containing protein [Clostridia bacterium]
MQASGDFTIENGILKKYTGPGGDVVVPDGVRRIERSAFGHCEELTAVTLPDSVTSVGETAFAGCRKLAAVTLPDHPVVLGEAAFHDCPRLADAQGYTIVQSVLFQYSGPGGEVVVPDGVTRIDSWAFGTGLRITSVVLPEGLTIIGPSAFDFCPRMVSVRFPDTLIFIGPAAFRHCSALTRLILPDKPLRIGERAFIGCPGLADERGFVIVRGVLYGYYGSDSEIVIPDAVHTIGDQAFRNCLTVTQVVLPDRLTAIGDQAFALCKNLTRMTLPTGLQRISRLAFAGCDRLTLRWDGRGDMGTNALQNVFCAIMPHVPFSDFHGTENRTMAMRGFFRAPELYTDSEIRWHYQQYAQKHRTALLPEIFRADLVHALQFYADHRQITAENFETEYLRPALAVHAAECAAFLLDYRYRFLADALPADEFAL